MKHTIIITGGHLTPADAVIDALIKSDKWNIYYVGRESSSFEDSSFKIEKETIEKYGDKVKLLTITTGKLQRYFSLNSLIQFFKIPIGFFESVKLIAKYKPNIVLSFGGYVALPISVAAFLSRVPVVTHEQTAKKGLANSLIEKIATKILYTWPDNKINVSNKNIISGLPLRADIFRSIKKLPVDLDKPLLYISGGSQGSHVINSVFEKIIPKLISDFSIIHQCGQNPKFDDYKKLVALKKSLPVEVRDRYYPVSYVKKDYLGWVYKNTFIAVGRSGANSVYELAALGIPSIFIPIPFSSNNEQTQNARFFETRQAGIILQQSDLSPKTLLGVIDLVKNEHSIYLKNAQTLKKSIILDADKRLVAVLEEVVEV